MKRLIITTLLLISVMLIFAEEEVYKVSDFTLPDFEGNMVTLSDFEGLIILDFWATWCPPCREEVPVLQMLYDQYKDRGVHIIGISTENIATQQKFKETMVAQDVAMDYTLLIDADRSVFTEYGIQGIPTTIFIRDDLTQIYREVGFTKAYTDKFIEIIEENLPEE